MSTERPISSGGALTKKLILFGNQPKKILKFTVMIAVIFESNLHQVIINVLETVPTAAMTVARNNISQNKTSDNELSKEESRKVFKMKNCTFIIIIAKITCMYLF